MAENQEKIDELLTKLRTLGSRAKGIRAQVSEPVLDRILARANKNLARFGDGNGRPQQPQQPQPEVRRTCPTCGRSFTEDVAFCNCGFDFSAEARRQQERMYEREKLERNSRIGVITGG